MKKPKDPRDLAVALLSRSTCSVQVSAVLADSHGVFGWGWNNSGRDGMGEHDEVAATRAINRSRAAFEGILYVTAQRKRNWRCVTAKPCDECSKRIEALGIWKVWYRDKDGIWKKFQH